MDGFDIRSSDVGIGGGDTVRVHTTYVDGVPDVVQLSHDDYTELMSTLWTATGMISEPEITPHGDPANVINIDWARRARMSA